MLGRLLKYELKAMGRILLPLYGVLIALSVIWGIGSGGGHTDEPGVVNVTLLVTTIILAIGVIVATLIMIITRFRSNLLGDEGYLWFTLPVSTGTHICAKTISATCWGMLSGLVMLITILVVFTFTSPPWDSMRELFAAIREVVDNNYIHLLLETILLTVLGMAEAALEIFAAISVGHLAPRMKGLCAFGAYVGFNIIEGIVAGIANTAGVKVDYNVTYVNDNLSITEQNFPLALFALLALCAIYFTITWVVLDKKLNLE